MKQLFNMSVFLVLSFSGNAQDSRIFYRNNVQLNAGYTFYDGFSGGLSLNERGINRFAAIGSYDGFLTEKLSIGVFGGFTTSFVKEDSVYYQTDWYVTGDYYTRKIKERRHFIGVKGSTYFINNERLQAFLSVGIGVGRKRSYRKYDDEFFYDSRRLVFIYDLHFGANYYFSEHLGATVSMGYPLTLFRVGVSYRY
jgi:hypothetical protein